MGRGPGEPGGFRARSEARAARSACDPDRRSQREQPNKLLDRGVLHPDASVTDIPAETSGSIRAVQPDLARTSTEGVENVAVGGQPKRVGAVGAARLGLLQ